MRTFILTLVFIAFLAQPAAAGPNPQVDIKPRVRAALAKDEQTRVLITLRGPADGLPDAAHKVAIARLQADVLSRLPADFTLTRRYAFVPALAGIVTPKSLAALQADPAVASVVPDEPTHGHLGQAVAALRADVARQTFGVTGQGVTVAVLDSGVDTDHPDLADDIVAQGCFTDANCPPFNTDAGGSAEDANGHGTHVASIITSGGLVAAPGFAPDADIVAVRVLDAQASGWTSDWIAGLDWVRGQLETHPIRIVNMSLGTDYLFSANCDADIPAAAAVIAQLTARGVALFASSGNNGAINALSSPACHTGVIAVGATYDSALGREPDSGTYQTAFGPPWPACYDASTSLTRITCFSNSSPLVDLVAPGARITASGIGGALATYVGVSQATAVASGVAALVLQVNPALSPAELETVLKSSGPAVTDPKNGLSFATVDALNAVSAVQGAPRTLSGRVDLQGRADNGGVQVTAGNYSATTQPDGSFSLALPPGVYQVKAERAQYLTSQTTFQVAAGSSPVNLPLVRLLGGDANSSGMIDLYDLVLIAGAYDQAVPPANQRADINGDGRVDLLDLTMVGANYGKDSPQGWAAQKAGGGEKTGDTLRGHAGVVVDAPREAKVGEEVVAQVRWAGTGELVGGDITLRFDATRLVPLGQAEAGVVFAPGQGFVALNRVDADQGRVRFTAVRLGEATKLAGEGALFSIRFRALQTGPVRVKVERADVMPGD